MLFLMTLQIVTSHPTREDALTWAVSATNDDVVRDLHSLPDSHSIVRHVLQEELRLSLNPRDAGKPKLLLCAKFNFMHRFPVCMCLLSFTAEVQYHALSHYLRRSVVINTTCPLVPSCQEYGSGHLTPMLLLLVPLEIPCTQEPR